METDTPASLATARARVTTERQRCQRLLDDIRRGTAALLRLRWDTPRIQQLGVPLSLIFRVAAPGARIIRRHGAVAELRLSERQAKHLITSAVNWLGLEFRAARFPRLTGPTWAGYRGALRDRRIIAGWQAELSRGAALMASLRVAAE